MALPKITLFNMAEAVGEVLNDQLAQTEAHQFVVVDRKNDSALFLLEHR